MFIPSFADCCHCTVLITSLGLPCFPLMEHWNVRQRRHSKGLFSADIYGDGIQCEAGPNEKMKAIHINTASQYLPTIKALTSDHWTKIFDHVREILEQGRKRKRSKSISSQVSSLADGYEEVETHEYILLSDSVVPARLGLKAPAKARLQRAQACRY